MITDALLQLSTAQAVTATAVSANTIDLGSGTGSREALNFAFGVDVSATAAGAATVTFQIISSASPSLTSPTVLAQSDAIGKAELTAGRRPICLKARLSDMQPLGHRYLGAQYVVTNGPLTAGAFTCQQADESASGIYPTKWSAA